MSGPTQESLRPDLAVHPPEPHGITQASHPRFFGNAFLNDEVEVIVEDMHGPRRVIESNDLDRLTVGAVEGQCKDRRGILVHSESALRTEALAGRGPRQEFAGPADRRSGGGQVRVVLRRPLGSRAVTEGRGEDRRKIVRVVGVLLAELAPPLFQVVVEIDPSPDRPSCSGNHLVAVQPPPSPENPPVSTRFRFSPRTAVLIESGSARRPASPPSAHPPRTMTERFDEPGTCLRCPHDQHGLPMRPARDRRPPSTRPRP